eukprot:TRINITY_DN13353_c1_g1_i3.p1 TRINITY_DN13353_c1_g1~~TRINITY_DN13353_c1_g1_i3.p1  ORF type:complete len:1543 (-),score=251.14 TRINITY_DN13353_c1_g1_i3:233-4861(-)
MEQQQASRLNTPRLDSAPSRQNTPLYSAPSRQRTPRLDSVPSRQRTPRLDSAPSRQRTPQADSERRKPLPRQRTLHSSPPRKELPRRSRFSTARDVDSGFAEAWARGARGVLAASYSDLLQIRLLQSKAKEVPEGATKVYRNQLLCQVIRLVTPEPQPAVIEALKTELHQDTDDDDDQEPLWRAVQKLAAKGDGPVPTASGKSIDATRMSILVKADRDDDDGSSIINALDSADQMHEDDAKSLEEFWTFYRKISTEVNLAQAHGKTIDAGAGDWKSPIGGVRSIRTRILREQCIFELQSQKRDHIVPAYAQTKQEGSRAWPRGDAAEWLHEGEKDKGLSRELKSYVDLKRRRQMLETVPAAISKVGLSPKRSGRRGLALNRLPPEPPDESKSRSVLPALPTSARCTRKKDLAAHEEARKVADSLSAFQEVASESSRDWSAAMHHFVTARGWHQHLNECKDPPSRGIMSSREEVDLPPMELFHRPWSREGFVDQWSDKVDGYLSPLQRFAKVCLSSGIRPRAESIRYLGQVLPWLSFRACGYSDEDVLALAAAFPNSSNLEAVDMGGNPRLTDTSVCKLLGAVAAHCSEQFSVLRMDQCSQLGKETVHTVTHLLKTSMLSLRTVDMSGIAITKAAYPTLAAAVESHPHLQVVCLGATGLGTGGDPVMTAQVVSSLISGVQIEHLELGYNNFDAVTFDVLGRGMIESDSLAYLGLAATAGKQTADKTMSSMTAFLERLPGDTTLTSLDISANCLEANAALIVEYALRKHKKIRSINVSRNPLGLEGMRCMIRLLALETCPELFQLVFDDCMGVPGDDVTMGLVDTDPSGRYDLDMSHVGQRTLFRLLLTILSEFEGQKNGFLKQLMHVTGHSENPLSVDSIKRKKGIWQVPTSGHLKFELNFHDFLLQGEQDADCAHSLVVERMFRKTRLSLHSERKILAVLAKIKGSPSQLSEELVQAVSRDFLLTADQVIALSLGPDPLRNVSALSASLFDPGAMWQASGSFKTFEALVALEREAHQIMTLNLENPTGSYMLNLSKVGDRSVAQRLMLLNRWQLHLWHAQNLIDGSQLGTGKCFRNVNLDARPFVWTSEEWRIKLVGELSFYFVSLMRPKKNAEQVLPEMWGKLLIEIRQALGIMKGGSKRLSAQEVIWILRGISGTAWITCSQLRSLLCSFPKRADRKEVLSMWFLRCVDWPINSKLCEAKFNTADWAELTESLGYLYLFPYFQPELSAYCFDLASGEQRRCLHLIIKLANSEHVSNVKQTEVDWNGPNGLVPHFEPFTAGIPMSWDQYDFINTKGVVRLRYSCAVDHVNIKARKRLAATSGGWSNLPQNPQGSVEHWAVLNHIPNNVVRVIVFLIRNWKSIDAAFENCNLDGDSSLNHREFVERLARVGCCRSPKKKGAKNEPEGENYDAEDPAQLEALSSVYRFLDSSNDGEISRNEFSVLRAVWKEIEQSMHELHKDIMYHYESLESAHMTADLNANGGLSKKEYYLLLARCDFDGPSEQIFMYLDRNANDEISKDEFMLLELYSKQPPLPDFTDCMG